MSAILLTKDGDFDLTARGLQITSDVQTLAIQDIRGRLLLWLGEWFLDVRQGFPWLEVVFVGRPDIRIIGQLLRRAISTSPFVEKLAGVEVSFDKAAREFSFAFNAQLTDGTVLEVGEGTPFVMRIDQPEVPS